MKKINKLTIAASISLIICVEFSQAQAQFATYNISDYLFNYFKAQRDYVQNTNLQSINTAQSLQMAQANQNVTNTDYRNRTAMVYHDITMADEQQRPTIAQCIEVSKVQQGVSAIAETNNSYGRTSGGGGRKKTDKKNPPQDYNPKDTNKIQENIRTNENAQAMVLENMKNVGTCSPRYGKLCPATGIYPLADVSTVGLLTNLKPNANVTPGANEIQNYSLTPAAYNAGQQYINVATLSNAPKFPDSSDLPKNPGYVAMYNSFITKLNTSRDVLTGMLNMRKAPATTNSTFTFDKTDIGKDWKVIFPNLTIPVVPSFFEYLNARTMSDVFGPNALKTDTQGSDHDLWVRIQAKIALNNLIAWQQFQQQEKTNLLLAHLLVQQTVPVSKDTLDKEYQKFGDQP